MGKLVKSIQLTFDDFISKESSLSSMPLGLRLDNQLTETEYKFTNYSFFLTISMKNNFATAEAFYTFIKGYFQFLKQNCLVEAVDVSFEYYKGHKKLHAHALIDFHQPGKCTDSDWTTSAIYNDKQSQKIYRVQQARFKTWSKEYFRVKERITLDRHNFYLYKIVTKHKIPNVNITKEYLIKDRDMMKTLNFKPIKYWIKKYIPCINLISIKKTSKNHIVTTGTKDINIAKLASDINNDLRKYNELKLELNI